MKEDKHPLDAVDWGVIPIISYRGVYVTKQPNGLYTVFGEKDLLPGGVDSIIDKSNEWIGKSIKQ